MISLTVQGEFPGLNEIIKESKCHFSKYAKNKRYYTDIVMLTCLGARHKAIKQKVNIELTWYTKNAKKDPDNVAAGIKYILDGLTLSGTLENDSRKYIGSITHHFCVDKNNPRVEIKLIECVEQNKA
jgi:Holliday junction resolvase RusA-like endonuclease